MTSAILVQCSTNYCTCIKPSGSWSLCEFVMYVGGGSIDGEEYKTLNTSCTTCHIHLYLNCGERYEDMIDQESVARKLVLTSSSDMSSIISSYCSPFVAI